MQATTSEYAKQIASTIYQQLGGNQFATMTGTKNFVYGENELGTYLQMKLSQNKNRFTHLIVQYKEALDEYTMEFCKVDRYGTKSNVNLIVDVHAEDLALIFEAETGLYTHL